MPLFRKIGAAAKKIGAKLFGPRTVPKAGEVSQAERDAARLRREEEVLRERGRRAEAEANEAKRLARELASPTGRAKVAGKAAEAESERIRQKVMELAKRERLAREAASRAREEAEEARRQAERREREAAKREQEQIGNRGIVYEGRRRRGEAIYESVKAVGSGNIPDVKRFILLGEQLSRFASSNVEIIQYDLGKQQLYVKFIAGDWYRYDAVPRSMAESAYLSFSKGIWIWSNIRVRGRGNSRRTQKRFTRGVSPPSYLPLTGSAAEAALRGGF